jgi:hypothetical protein
MDTTEQYVDAAAAAVGLHIAGEHRPGVLRFFRLAQTMADSLMAIDLGPSDDSGSFFVPLAPPQPEDGT